MTPERDAIRAAIQKMIDDPWLPFESANRAAYARVLRAVDAVPDPSSCVTCTAGMILDDPETANDECNRARIGSRGPADCPYHGEPEYAAQGDTWCDHCPNARPCADHPVIVVHVPSKANDYAATPLVLDSAGDSVSVDAPRLYRVGGVLYDEPAGRSSLADLDAPAGAGDDVETYRG